MEALVFAQLFPFSEKAKRVLKDMDVSVGDVPDGVVRRAALMVSRANSNKEYSLETNNPSKQELETEVMAFPVAKMFVSLMRAPNMAEKFSSLAKKNTFNYLVGSENPKELCLELAEDLALPFFLSEEKGFFVEVPLMEFLKIYFTDPQTKLVNKPLENGKVFLSQNEFAHFLSQKAYAKIFDSLPIPKDAIPLKFHSLAKSIDSQLVTIERKDFNLKIEGKMDPDLFPPCMKQLYADQLAGKKLSYPGRVSLASFLQQLGMTKPEMLALFAKSPDYKKHITDYHVNRIYDKKLSAPGCKKMAEQGLKVPECQKACTSNHPLKYYMRQLRARNRMKNGAGAASPAKAAKAGS
jgi:DNA primase large subunit